jgi:hypothetical protein
MTLIAVFTRAGTDDAKFEVEVEDIVFDFDCVEDATTDRTVATVGERFGGQRVFQPVGTTEMFDTLTVLPKRANTHVVSFITPQHEVDDPPFVFLFDDLAEAQGFRDHIRNLYGFRDASIETLVPTTYDSAIEAVVDAIGPSPE